MTSKKKMGGRVIAFFMSIVFVVLLFPMQSYATDFEMPCNRHVVVDGHDMGAIMTFDYYYDHDVYVPLKSIAATLVGTSKAYAVECYNGEIHVRTGVNHQGSAYVWPEEEIANPFRVDVARHKLFINDEERKYYSVKKGMPDGSLDYFYSLIDVAMMLNLSMDIREDVIYIDTTKDFAVTPEQIVASGYLQGVNGLVIGDATTGDIYLSYDAEKAFAIASTTKLMTYLLVQEAISEGEIGANDFVTITPEAEKISKGVDGTIPMMAGWQVPLEELLLGLLLPSSNECGYMLSVYVAGSEEAFAKRMNEKAKELGLDSAYFYNAHGLPLYTEQLIPGKVQNHMSAADMFTLTGYILREYPQIREITSRREANLPTLGQYVKNTNPLLYNIPEAKGLKTGTTNKAGACLVTLLEAEYEGQKHDLVVVLLGAETNIDRETVSEIAARCALLMLRGGASVSDVIEAEPEGIPQDPEKVMQRLVRKGLQNSAADHG
ncbi:MAG: serine hydrolase [Lachnospiraceae bacterium]|nr:serine hydrolase [Lachnospiraceae bacterium]